MTTRSLHSFLQHLRRSLHPSREVALPDAQLLERWTTLRDQAAFELLLWRHGPMVLNTCRRLLRRGEDVEDVFQATFLVLVRKAGSIRRGAALAAWLHRVACRIALRVRAANAQRAGREQPLVDVPAAADAEEAAARDLRAVLDEEIDRLPSHYRRAFVLCCLEGKSQEEAARLLACPRGTLSSWLTRGRERLRQRLLRRGVDLSVVGLTAALAPDASAGVLASLVAPLLRGAAAGGVVPAGIMSAQTIALAEGMLRTMLMTKVKIAAVVLLLGGLFAAGVGTLSHSTHAADPQAKPRESEKAAKDVRFQALFEKGAIKNDGIAWGKTAHGLQAGIAFRPGDQESYTVGESVTFVVYLRNVSDKKIHLSHIEPLFAEFMPTVEDGDGKRLRVAPAPINLGDVPIVHRTLEPHERITLGYPWFRIRPAGWRGEILGPMCCAAPGRYKISYVGLPLRLNDDKLDVSEPGTGQVELDIRQTDTSKGDHPAKKSLDSRAPAKPKEAGFEAKGTSSGSVPATSFLNAREFGLPIKIDPIVRHTMRRVRLLGSRDRGVTFSMLGEAFPDDTHFDVQVPGDGLYHFVIQTEDEVGRLAPRHPKSVRPLMTVCVDTTPPLVELGADRLQKDVIRLLWRVRDENLDLSSMRLEYRLLKEEKWTEIPKPKQSMQPPPKVGKYDWTSSPDESVEVRLRVSDKARNESIARATILPEKRP